jgi:hypothetical protein
MQAPATPAPRLLSAWSLTRGEDDARSAAAAAVAAASTFNLDRRARHRSIRAEHAAVAGLWAQKVSAALAFIKEPAGVRRHLLDLMVTTMRAGNLGMKFGLHGRDHLLNNDFPQPNSGAAAVFGDELDASDF